MKSSCLKLLQFAALLICCSCAGNYKKTTGGAVAGSAMGAGLGAIVGNQSGHSGAGVAIGAAAGAIGGALIGHMLDGQDEENAQLRAEIDRQQAQLEENQRLIDELRRRGADVSTSDRGVVVNLPDILFDFNDSNLTADAQSMLGEMGEVLGTVEGRTISIEGHTDNVGSVDYNKRLSLRRAQTVAGSLRTQGIAAGQIEVHGYGEGQPISSNNTAEGRARNRRVEIVIENK